ncbi:hypothetical protein ACGF3J_24895, partial [Streptomyces sp. NPDC048171]
MGGVRARLSDQASAEAVEQRGGAVLGEILGVGREGLAGAEVAADWEETLRGYDAIFFGAVGWPEVLPDHVSLW